MKTNAYKSSNRGITLIEVMVAILLMTITLLGIAGLFGATTRYQLGVESRSSITYLFNDLAGRVRMNLDTSNAASRASWAQHYTDAAVSSSSWSAQQAMSTTPSVYCGTGAGTAAACTRAQLVEFDLAEVRASMAASMPQPALQLSGNAATGLIATFMWFDKDFTSINSGTVSLNTSATCTTSMNAIQQQTCCPTAANVASTPGVRCLNFRFTP
ncbi:MAG: type pilus modification protein PilV [Pseudomonadota bacterium]|jgi:type IV pilus assembly protein PilV